MITHFQLVISALSKTLCCSRSMGRTRVVVQNIIFIAEILIFPVFLTIQKVSSLPEFLTDVLRLYISV
jgi:hypothetical protein